MEEKAGIARAVAPRQDDHSGYLLSHSLGDRLYFFVLIRFMVVIAIVPGGLFASKIVGIRHLNLPALAIVAVILGLCNLVTFLIVAPYREKPNQAAASHRFLEGVMNLSIVIDFLCLTVALWILGGAQSPFQAFFIFHVIIASIMLSSRAAYLHALFGYFLLAGLIIGTWMGWIPGYYPEGAIPTTQPVSGRYVFTVLAVQGMLFALTALLINYLMKLLRAGERRLVMANRELDRISNLRRDFLHLALHNLRSPIGAVSMYLDNMHEGYGGTLSDQQTQWVERSKKRLTELMGFLHDLEFLTILESESFDQHASKIDLEIMLKELVEENKDLAQLHHHSVGLEMEPNLARIKGIPRLVREAIVNFIINAIHYTPDGGRIMVRAIPRDHFVRVEVQDNGRGIAPQDQTRLFQEFVRLQHDAPSVPGPPGSGLGLYIVRRIAETHGGRVELTSQLNQGSTFAIEFPIAE